MLEKTNKIQLPVLILAISCLLIFNNFSSVENLAARWMYEEEYGYGLLSLVVFFYLLYINKDKLLSGCDRSGSPWFSLLVFLTGVLLGVVGEYSSSFYISQFAVLCGFFGLTLLIFGLKFFWLILAIYIVLFLAVPLPYTLQAIFTVKLQLISTWVGVFFIDLFGIPVYAEGNVIDLGIYKLQVAEACSGLQYLYSLVCLAYIVAFLHNGSLKAKAAIAFFSIPFSIILNGFRISVAGFLTQLLGVEAAEGFIHIFQGWVVFSIGIIFILLFAYIVGLLEKNRQVAVTDDALASSDIHWNKPRPFLVVALLLSTLPLLLASLGPGIQERFQRSALITFPMTIGQWQGEPQKLSDVELSILKPSDYMLTTYRSNTQHSPVEFYVVYYESMEKGLSIHSPRVCLSGGGWEFDSFTTRSFNITEREEQDTINRVVIRKGDSMQLLYYWYQQRGRVFASEFLMKWYLFVDSMFRGRKDGALVRMSTPVHSSEAITDAEARLDGFLEQSTPLLPEYIPD